MNQISLRNLSAWEHFTTIGAIVWFLFAIIVGATYDDYRWWETDLQSGLVMCSLVFIFRDQFSLVRWPEAILILVFFVEFGRIIFSFVGTSEGLFQTTKFDSLDLGDDCAFTVATNVLVVTLFLNLLLWAIGRLEFRFSFAWAIRFVASLCLTIGVFRLSRSNSWLHHNFQDFSTVTPTYFIFVVTDLARISLIVSIANLVMLSTKHKGFLGPIILMVGALGLVEFSEWYFYERFIDAFVQSHTARHSLEFINEFINGYSTANNIHRFRSRIVEIIVVSLYCLILVTTTKIPFKNTP